MKKNKKEFPIELNGVANIAILLWQLENKDVETSEVSSKIVKELDFLERYMLALKFAAENNTNPPAWHDIKANPENYPTNKELRERVL